MNPLALRLGDALNLQHAQWGIPMEPLTDLLDRDDVELHEVSPGGVLAFVGDYVLAAWPPEEQLRAARKAYRLIRARVAARGFTLHMVYPRNFRSVIVTRKLGAKLLGVDSDGFVHYRLGTEEKSNGQEVSAAEAA